MNGITDGNLTDKVTVGDLNSNAMGTGARKSSGKEDYSLIYSPFLYSTFPEYNKDVNALLDTLGDFQIYGDQVSLNNAYKIALTILESTVPDFVYSELDTVVTVFTQGAKKYAPFNWMKGMDWSVCMGCIHRHILKEFVKGEVFDDESGQPHMAHVICNLHMLMFYKKYYPQGNDLPCSKVDFPPKGRPARKGTLVEELPNGFTHG